MRLHLIASALIGMLVAGNARAEDGWSESHDRARLRADVWLGLLYRQVETYGRLLEYGSRQGPVLPFDARELGAMHEVALDFGARIRFLGPAYFGYEIFLGGIGVNGAVDESTALFASGGVHFVAGMGGLFGVTLFRRGPVQVDAELFGGGQFFTFVLYHASTSDPFTGHREAIGEGIIAPRARVGFALSQTTTLSLWAGTNFVEPGEPELGVSLVFHFAKRACNVRSPRLARCGR